MERIGILGGTFDPPHSGHLELCKAVSEEIGLDKVLIIPTFIPPHKERESNVSSEDRLNMCKLAFTSDLFEVSDMEIKRKGKSYTFDTLNELKKIYPNAELYFIMGSDMFLTFMDWYNPKGILEMCKICTNIRDNEESYTQLYDYANENKISEKTIICKKRPIEVSSTWVREQLATNGNTEGLIPCEVMGYIKERGLYSERL